MERIYSELPDYPALRSGSRKLTFRGATTLRGKVLRVTNRSAGINLPNGEYWKVYATREGTPTVDIVSKLEDQDLRTLLEQRGIQRIIKLPTNWGVKILRGARTGEFKAFFQQPATIEKLVPLAS